MLSAKSNIARILRYVRQPLIALTGPRPQVFILQYFAFNSLRLNIL
jgi:hypothetical protein